MAKLGKKQAEDLNELIFTMAVAYAQYCEALASDKPRQGFKEYVLDCQDELTKLGLDVKLITRDFSHISKRITIENRA